jgi:hypothetical protein
VRVQTTIGSYGHAHGWSAVVVLELDGEQLLVEERHARSDDPDARGLVLRRYWVDERERRGRGDGARARPRRPARLRTGSSLPTAPSREGPVRSCGPSRATAARSSSTDATRDRSPSNRPAARSTRNSTATCTWSAPPSGDRHLQVSGSTRASGADQAPRPTDGPPRHAALDSGRGERGRPGLIAPADLAIGRRRRPDDEMGEQAAAAA